MFAAKIPYATEQGIFRVHPIHIPVYKRGVGGTIRNPGGKITGNFEKNAPPGDFHFEINKRFQLFAAKVPYATEQGIFRVHPIHIPVYIQSTFPSIKRGLSIQSTFPSIKRGLAGRFASKFPGEKITGNFEKMPPPDDFGIFGGLTRNSLERTGNLIEGS